MREVRVGRTELAGKKSGGKESEAEVSQTPCCSGRCARLGMVEGAHGRDSAVLNDHHPAEVRNRGFD